MTLIKDWDKTFSHWGSIEAVPVSKTIPSNSKLDELKNPNARPSLTAEFAHFAVLMASCYHRQRILLPHSCDAYLAALSAYVYVEYWLVEQDKVLFDKLLEDDTLETGSKVKFRFDFDTIWHMDFDQWVAAFDPVGSQVDTVLLAAPLWRATSDMLDAWDYIKPGRGHLFALIPFQDLLADSKDAKALRLWCAKRELDYGVPKKSAFMDGFDDRVVAVFGVRNHD